MSHQSRKLGAFEERYEKQQRQTEKWQSGAIPPRSIDKTFESISNNLTKLQTDIARITRLAKQGLQQESLTQLNTLTGLIPECQDLIRQKQEQIHHLRRKLEKSGNNGRHLQRLRKIEGDFLKQQEQFKSSQPQYNKYRRLCDSLKRDQLIRNRELEEQRWQEQLIRDRSIKREKELTFHSSTYRGIEDFSDSGSETESNNSSRQGHHQGHHQQQQQQMSDNIKALDRMELIQSEVERRAPLIQKMEEDLGYVHELFKDTHELVTQQQIGIDEIEKNILSVKETTAAGVKDVEKARELQKQSCLIM